MLTGPVVLPKRASTSTSSRAGPSLATCSWADTSRPATTTRLERRSIGSTVWLAVVISAAAMGLGRRCRSNSPLSSWGTSVSSVRQ